ncbi:vWA domain-containing protein [Butyrivibrio sp. VCB2006]|uniref:vWA domain-containing protein n=1 Tax=Butyrivibrio sp. VCB2006 TaxID=1280679 RepID=UPI000422B656|nr:VWA-like domain-containing protein [Butyrivibrio sp. VCB2006]
MAEENVLTKREQLDEAGKRVLGASRTELYIDMRFFGSALNSLGYEMDLSMTTVGTDAVSIRFNPSYVLRLFLEEPGKLNRTYLHMLLHCIFMHMYTSAGYKDERLFDVCADIVVESILDGMDYQCIYRVSSDYRDRWYELLEKEVKVLTVEKLYRYFSQEHELDIFELEKLEREFKLDDHGFWSRLVDKPSDDKDENSDNKPEDKEMPPLDDDYQNPFNNESNESEKTTTKYINPRRLQQIKDAKKDWDKEGKRIQTEIETIGKEHSDRLGKLTWLLKVQNTSHRDFREFLQRFKVLREEGGVDLDSFDYGMYSFGLEHYGNMPLIEENEFREVKKIQELVIAIDTSASCKDSLVQRFLNETAGILLDRESFFQRIKICVIQCDNQIQKTDFIEKSDEMNKYSSEIHVEGGYGTDFRPVFEHVEELKSAGKFENLKGLIYFTDGYGEFPDKPTSYDTAFVFPKDEDYTDENVPDWALKLYI